MPHSLRRALVAATTLVIASVPLAGPAQAEIDCSVAAPMVRDVWDPNVLQRERWYQTTVSGDAQVTYHGGAGTLSVHRGCPDMGGTVLCSGGPSTVVVCDISSNGLVQIAVHAPGGTPYALSVYRSGTPSTTPPVQCSDGVDNDFDGTADFPGDAGCSSDSGTSEGEPLSPSACDHPYPITSICVRVDHGAVRETFTAYGPRTYTAGTRDAAGAIDLYRFPDGTGGTVELPCVSLTVGTSPNACAALGGTYVSRVALLFDETVAEPGVAADQPLATVRVCSARYTAKHGGSGVEDIPAYSLC